jgi:hypothetical protein
VGSEARKNPVKAYRCGGGHDEPDRVGSGAYEASEDGSNLLYDGVTDTLVSLLLRNAQHLR